MKKIIAYSILSAVLILCSIVVFGQPGPGPGGGGGIGGGFPVGAPPGAGAPIDGGALALVGGVATYAYRKLRKNK